MFVLFLSNFWWQCKSNFSRQLFQIWATFEQVFKHFGATFREIWSNLWTGLVDTNSSATRKIRTCKRSRDWGGGGFSDEGGCGLLLPDFTVLTLMHTYEEFGTCSSKDLHLNSAASSPSAGSVSPEPTGTFTLTSAGKLAFKRKHRKYSRNGRYKYMYIFVVLLVYNIRQKWQQANQWFVFR